MLRRPKEKESATSQPAQARAQARALRRQEVAACGVYSIMGLAIAELERRD